MKPAWIPFASRAVPRYTSYPTAADFSAATGEPEARRWAVDVARDEPISVYLHVPFCETLCWYCGCATSVPNGYRRVGDYAARMQAEIALWAAALGPHGGIGHLHFGGGSPNALRSGDFAALVETLRCEFEIRPDAEVAGELDPRTMHDGQVEACAAAGAGADAASAAGTAAAWVSEGPAAPAAAEGRNRADGQAKAPSATCLAR